MKNSVLLSLAIAGLVVGCGGDDRNVAAQQPYETVQEGSVAGVTTTIQGPGEMLPPISGTNADTTTAFALNPAAVPAQSTMAGSVPPPVPSYEPAPAYTPPPAAPAPRRETSAPPPVRSAEREPAVTPPPATETTATTVPEPEPSNPPAESTDTAVPEAEDEEPPPPPPPTTTDTNPTETAPPTTTDGRS